MQLINTIFLSHNVNDWLAKTQLPRILHVFDYVCNLINERGEILSIVTPEIGNGPFNLVIENDICFSEHLNLQSPIRRAEPVEASNSPRRLDLGNLTINTAGAKPWNPRPDWEMLHARRDDILTQLLSLSVPNYQASIPKSLVSNLSYALTKVDISTSKAIASRLAGLGQGLTPSGDDFLLGAIYATWILHPPEVADTLAKEIANFAAPLTTSLSAAWLRSAGRGETGILWHNFFDALIDPDPNSSTSLRTSLQSPISKLLAVGATSGADAFAGFMGVCTAYKERIIDQCPS